MAEPSATLASHPPGETPKSANERHLLQNMSLNRVEDFSIADVRFSNRPFEVKHFQTIHHCSVDVAHGLALLFGIGTKALPLWDSRTRRNNLWVGLAVTPTAG